jgi:hypothetical protein
VTLSCDPRPRLAQVQDLASAQSGSGGLDELARALAGLANERGGEAGRRDDAAALGEDLSQSYFHPGERIVIREVLNGRVWTVRPVTVVEDSKEHLVSYLAHGTLIDYPVDAEHEARCFSMWISGEWELRKKEFYAPGMLRIAPHGQPRDQRCRSSTRNTTTEPTPSVATSGRSSMASRLSNTAVVSRSVQHFD